MRYMIRVPGAQGRVGRRAVTVRNRLNRFYAKAYVMLHAPCVGKEISQEACSQARVTIFKNLIPRMIRQATRRAEVTRR